MNGHETIWLRQPGGGGVDDDGYPLPSLPPVEVGGCVVQEERSDADLQAGRIGTYSAWHVHAPAGTEVADGWEVKLRGVWWRVETVPFDWSTNRRPMFARHKPNVEFLAVRGKA